MNRPIRILELRSVRGTGGGPEKTILLGTARTDRAQFLITVCYLRDVRDPVFGIDQKAASLPIDYVELRERHSFDTALWGQLRQLIRQREIDIVHAHEYKTDLLAWLLAKAEGTIALSTAHGWTGHSSREAWLYYPIDKRLLARFPRVIAVSGEIRRELVRHGASPDRVTTILNGIDHRQFQRDANRVEECRRQLGIQPGEIVLGSVGRLEPQKRFDLLIDAVAATRRSYPNVRCLIAGDGSLRQTLEEHIRRVGVGDICRLLGHRNDVSTLHHAFDLYVQSSDYEGTPNAVLEAMAFETPVVATDVGGTAELISDGRDGWIVDAGNPDALACAIRAALDTPAERHGRAQAARRRIETDLSFDTRMAHVEAVYRSLMERRQSRSPGRMVAVL